MPNQRRNWTREETIVALNMFCTIPFNECSARHPLIREVAELIGRTPAALNMKVGNLGRFDAALAARGVTGLSNGSALDKIVWDEFYGDFNKLALESEQILSSLRNQGKKIDLPSGEEIERVVKQRINQDFFRRMVLASYNNKCCITGLSNSKMLEACHISSWSDDEVNRTNPHNGLSMTPTLHRAYDNLLIAVSPDYEVIVSDELLGDAHLTDFAKKFYNSINGRRIMKPEKFLPARELLDIHYHKFLSKCV